MMFLLIYIITFPANAFANGAEVGIQLLVGYPIGIIGGIAVGITGAAAHADILERTGKNNACPSGQLGQFVMDFIVGATPGMILASSASIYKIGKSGNFWTTLLGASIPPLIGAVTGIIHGTSIEAPTPVKDCFYEAAIGAFRGSLLSPVGAVAAYQYSAQSKRTDIVIPLKRIKF
jgi:hypothetical protein